MQGAAVGIGAILPAISGGVLCMTFGLYQPMMELLTNPKKHFKTHAPIFIPFGIGWVVAAILVARVLGGFFDKHAEVATTLFFGLVCGTMPMLFRESVKSDANKSWTPFVLSLSISYMVFHIINIMEGDGAGVILPENFLSFMFCGFMWGLSMIIPGMTSSTVLTFLGLSEPFYSGIGSFDMAVLIPFGIGLIVTVLLFARLVNMLFKRYYATISRIILGFVIASSFKSLPHDFGSTETMLISVACFLIGFLFAILMEKIETRANPIDLEE